MLTGWENGAIARLLEPEFPGRSELCLQLDRASAKTIDDHGNGHGCIDIRSHSPAIAEVLQRVPSEGQAADADGVDIHVLLHVVGGRMSELEIFKDDGSDVVRLPDPDDIDVFVFDPAWNGE